MAEYTTRRRLAKLGSTTSTSELSYFKALSFCFIDQEIDRLETEKMKKRKRK